MLTLHVGVVVLGVHTAAYQVVFSLNISRPGRGHVSIKMII